MCQFFSVCSKDGQPYYFDWALREKVIKGELKFEPDSHTSILDYYGFKGLAQDRFNKYEYNPLTKNFQIDRLCTEDDSILIKDFCEKLNFKRIVPQLTFNPIIHPFKDRDAKKVTKSDLKLLKQWASVWASVWDSVRANVGDSVRAYVSSFFDLPKWKRIEHKKGENPFQSCIDLWHRGIVPSFDGKVWRLHGYKGKVLKVIPKDEL